MYSHFEFPLASWASGGNWSSCRSVHINRRLLVHQLVLLMFDHRALLTHLRLQLLQSLHKFLLCGFDHSSTTRREQVAEEPCSHQRNGERTPRHHGKVPEDTQPRNGSRACGHPYFRRHAGACVNKVSTMGWKDHLESASTW